ncbi:M3 family metallopeptidase [Flavobacteriaceae bacterium]|jgi:peptidyl-dipeptidase Dcp|nr:M3 family metallopeptidase [Flavobacteriaceae bacterium]
MNVLFSDFDYAPFNQIKNSDYLTSIRHGINELKSEIDTILSNKNTTFKNTIEALDYSGLKLDRITSIFFNINAAETSKEIQDIAVTLSPELSELKNYILLNDKLYKKVKTVYNLTNKNSLSNEENTLLENTYKSFLRNGANLSNKDKNKLRKLDIMLGKLSLNFGQNLLKETNEYELLISDEKKLDGLSHDHKEAAKMLAKSKNKKGWLFTLDYPSFSALITYCKNRSLRKEITIAFGQRAFKNNESDNQKVILEIINLRYQKAILLGYKSYSEYVLEERMAKNTKNVMNFLEGLVEKVKPVAKKEFKVLENYAKSIDNIDNLEKWDISFYTEMYKKHKYDVDQEKLKPYFSLTNVLNGAFEISNKLYGLNFKKNSTIDTYNDEVNTYEVKDEKNNFIALLYTDFHPRKGKRGGAWMTSYKPQYIFKNNNQRPHISIVCNFTRPIKNKPSLLTFNEVTTLFHEFGHALHGILANTKFKSLSGTNVSWDFVELPSQIFENWCYEEEALNIFAFHYKTKKLIPIELINKIKESANYNQASQTLRQLSLAILDMNWHNINPIKIKSVKEYEHKILKKLTFIKDLNVTCTSTSFSHIFQGGYSSGYYSYKWAEVLDADAFEYFKEKGIFNKSIASKFKDNILSKGGTQDPMDLYIKFRGRKPKINALLNRAGIS